MALDLYDGIKEGDIPALPNRRLWTSVTVLLCGAAALLGVMGDHYVTQQAGPKNGITFVDDGSCDVVGGFGPVNMNGLKMTERDIRAQGGVIVTLATSQRPESSLRNSGSLSVPVFVNELSIECVNVGPAAPADSSPNQFIRLQNNSANSGHP